MLKSVLKVTGSWLVLAACAVVSLLFFDELKAGMGYALGIEVPSANGTAVAGRPVPGEQAAKSSGGGVELKAGRNGHFETTAEINGRPIEVLVDTGATLVALSFEDAERAGIYMKDADYTQYANTANGRVRAAPVMLDRISIGDITVRNVQASVAEPGRQSMTLLGMAFLSKLSRTEMRKGVLVLYD
jgi:aspartyl protease family protein